MFDQALAQQLTTSARDLPQLVLNDNDGDDDDDDDDQTLNSACKV
jgi:hypothetical protein